MAKARIDSIDILKVFRATLFKFAEAAGAALGDAESDIHRTINWLDNEQLQKWVSEHRKRQTNLVRAKEALRMKQVFKGAAGSKQSTVDEEKTVQRCQKLLDEAVVKINAVKQHSRKLQKELLLYKGQTQRFQTVTSTDIPMAAALLGKMIIRLEAYASLAPESARSSAQSAASTAGVGAGDGGTSLPAQSPEEDLGEVFKRLRNNTPDLPVRVNAIAGSVHFASADQLSETDRETIAELAVGAGSNSPPADDAKIVVHASLADKKRLYLERLAPAFDGDSGWYLGPAEVGVPAAVATVTIAQALQARPDWKELLALPTGSLVVIDGDVIAAVLSPENKELFTEASMAKLLKSADAAATEEPAPEETAEEIGATDEHR